MASARAAIRPQAPGDRAARVAERALRFIGDARVGLGLLVLTGLVNAVAAFLPDGAALLDSPPYALLLGVVALSGVAAVGVRAPAAWREWRQPGAVQPGPGAVQASVETLDPDRAATVLDAAGYRTRVERRRGRWAVHGVRRGWSRFAGIASHLALVLVVLGAAIGAAFGSETVFSLMRGDQALLDAPRPGFASAIRLERFDADFDADGRPQRLDTEVTFLRDGDEVRQGVLRVNEPGDFDGYLVHPWTYGPAVRLRVTTLGGTPLLAAPVPLDQDRDGVPSGSVELPTAGMTLGLAIADAAANELGVSAVSDRGVLDAVRLRPGQQARVGNVLVTLDGFDAWVTFMSRRDPGVAVLFVGAALLCLTLAVAFWLPRRRITVRPRGDGVVVLLRGERFDRPSDELRRVVEQLRAAT